MKIINARDYQELSQKAAEMIIKQIKTKPNSILGLASGNTVIGLYRELGRAYQAGQISFIEASTFNLDEYVGLAVDEKNSCHYHMDEHLFKQTDFKVENIHLPNGVAEDLEAECVCYENLIKQAGGIDLQILGIGLNGHLGFNEPGSSFNSITRIVDLTKGTRQANAKNFINIKEVPKQAITMGIATIMQARQIILLANGRQKAGIIKRALQGEVTIKVPASVLQKHNNTAVILDEEAASKL